VQSTEAKVWWLAKADEIRAVKGVPVLDAVKKVAERFQFAAAPTTLPIGGEAYKFQEGKLVHESGTITIKELSIYNDGFAVEVYSTTDDARIALDQVLVLGFELGVRRPVTPPLILLNSMIVVDFPNAINGLVVGGPDSLSEIIAQNVSVSGKEDLRTIDFQMDPASVPREWGTLNPSAFRLERRANSEFSLNRYFSFAHADTEKHLTILRHVEKLITA
jgi:hypothetical protein